MLLFQKIILFFKKTFKKKGYRSAAFGLAALLVFLYYPLKKPLIRDDYSRIITDRKGQILRVFLTEDQQYCLPPQFIDTIPEKLSVAVIHFEDKYFKYHPGINPVSLAKAIYLNVKHKKIVSGASTITMQIARIRKGRKRSAGNKFLELTEAFRIEAQYSKKEILKLYLNHAPYGGNIIGYQAASWRYFGKPPKSLSWSEACLLAVLPNSPGNISPVKNNDLLLKKRNKLLISLHQSSIIDTLTLQNSLSEPMPKIIVPFDFLAPHLTRKIDNEQYYKRSIIQTSIDRNIQQRANYLVKRYYRLLEHYGIKNTSVIIVENKTRKVRAYIGSQDYYGDAGKVDGVMAPRSSGSILKPFLYALAFQDGLIIPESKLQDIPTYYGSFSPHNASEMYNGIVTSHDALVRSLNVPAVRLLYTYGHYKFYDFLKNSGISTLYRSADNYGLPLIIGGAEVTLWDMARLYCGLANEGALEDLCYYEDETLCKQSGGKQILDTLSTVMVLNILKDIKRPGAEYYWNKFNDQSPIAWKTGTSYGHKDAWAIGVSPEWTVAVWVGNFDATTNKNLTGAGSAGPLLFDLFDGLPHTLKKTWWNQNEYNFEHAEICEETGYLATDKCPKSKIARIITEEKLKTCPYHFSVVVDSNNKYSVCSKCWTSGYHKKNFLTYPPLVKNYIRKYGGLIEKIPVHNPQCPVNRNESFIEINYPKNDSRIIIVRDFDGEFQPLVCSAAHLLQDQTIYWYLDTKYLGQTFNSHKITVIPDKGEHKLTLIDSFGNTQTVIFYSSFNP